MEITLIIVTVYVAGLTTGWTIAWNLKERSKRPKRKTATRTKRVKA